MPKNPLGNLRAGRVSSIYDSKGNKIGVATGPHPSSLKSYRGAKTSSMYDVLRMLKSAQKKATNKLVDLRAYGKFYTDAAKDARWVSTGKINIDTLVDLAEHYDQSGFDPEDFAMEVFNMDVLPEFVLQWFVKYK